MASLPKELLVDILSRLPVESLVRFKCVCKSWYAHFNNPDFASKHMKNQSDGGAILLKYWPGRGFGYDPKTDDCKLVRVVGYWDDENKLGMLPSKAEVFSMRYDSMWRAISTADIRVYIWAGSGYERFFDGVYYWQGYDTSRMNELVLLSFDMAEEVFSKTPLPEICEYRYVPGRPLNLVRTHLGVFNNESIALFVYMICGHEPCFEVWVMKEIDGKESWIKQLTIGPVPRIQMPLLFWKNCKELLHEDANGRIFSSNLVTLENIEIRIERGVVFTRPATDYYRKTLVSVKAREGRTLQLDK